MSFRPCADGVICSGVLSCFRRSEFSQKVSAGSMVCFDESGDSSVHRAGKGGVAPVFTDRWEPHASDEGFWIPLGQTETRPGVF